MNKNWHPSWHNTPWTEPPDHFSLLSPNHQDIHVTTASKISSVHICVPQFHGQTDSVYHKWFK